MVIFIGESFRTGGQFSRVIGEATSVNDQIAAAITHKMFISYLEHKGHKVTTSIGTYHTPYVNQLIDIYKPSYVNIYTDRIGIDALFYNSFAKINNLSHFDHVIFIRIDLFLKEEFFRRFTTPDKITFLCNCWIKLPLTPKRYPRVNDMMLFIPKQYFLYLNKIRICHECWEILCETTPLTSNDFAFLLDTLHDSNTEKDYNPIYRIVNRPESKIFHSRGFTFGGLKK
jgi:hypothetical protein